MSFQNAKGPKGGETPEAHNNPANRTAHVPGQSCHELTTPAQLTCPRCGGFAQRLPESQDAPTHSQSHESCWLLSDGTQPYESAYRDGRLCSQGRYLQAGLLSALLERLGEGNSFSTDLLANDSATTLAFLRFAQQHPLVSSDLVLLLLERLRHVRARAIEGPTDRDGLFAVLLLTFRGCGGARTVATRHQTELQALLTDLLDEGRWLCDLFLPKWSSHGGHQVESISLDDIDGPNLLLAWPPVSHARQGGQV